MSTTKVVIIDKQPLFRAGVKQAFMEQHDFKIVEASPDDNLSMIIEEDLPDVILLDIDAPSLGSDDLRG
jgi:DNA-binding NarL/FixJ family response regulator